MSKRLLVIGNNSIHIYNFIRLVESYFDKVLLLSDTQNSWDIDTKYLNFSIRRGSFKNLKDLRETIIKFNPSVVHIHQVDTRALLTIFALRGLSIPRVLTAWGSDILINPKKSLLMRYRARYILQNIDTLTADSNIVIKEARGLANRDIESYNINFGIEPYRCNTPKESIIYTNRLHKKLYNIDKIIISFSKLIAKDSSWRLIIAGEGEESKSLKNLVKRLGIEGFVEFVGWVDRESNYRYYCKSKIYISIPSSDSISISLVEAIASKCIIFASDIEANREILDDNIGFIESDLESLNFEKFRTISWKDYYKSQKEIVDKFSRERNTKRYLDIYKRYIKE